MPDTKPFPDFKLENLLKLAPIAEEEKKIWLEKMPQMDDDQKGLLMLNLWKEIMLDFQDNFMNAVYEKIDEMAKDEGKSYTPDDFRALKSKMFQELVKRVSEGQDLLKAEEIREKLKNNTNLH